MSLIVFLFMLNMNNSHYLLSSVSHEALKKAKISNCWEQAKLAAVEVRTWKGNYLPLFFVNVIPYLCHKQGVVWANLCS